MPIASIDDINEWVVFVSCLLCYYFYETVLAICEFDVGSGLIGEEVVGLKAFDEKNVYVKERWAKAMGRGTSIGG